MTCVCEWYTRCWSPKRILMGGAWLVGSCNRVPKSALMEEMLLPESRRTSWVVCWRRAIAVQTGDVDDVEAWTCGGGLIVGETGEVDDVETWTCGGGSPYGTPRISFPGARRRRQRRLIGRSASVGDFATFSSDAECGHSCCSRNIWGVPGCLVRAMHAWRVIARSGRRCPWEWRLA